MKRTSLIALALVLCMLFSACGTTPPETTAESTPIVPETTATPDTTAEPKETAETTAPEATLAPETTDSPETTAQAPESTEAEPKEETTYKEVPFVENTYTVNEANSLYKLLGRAYYADGVLCCNTPAAGLEFDAVCKGDIVIDLEASVYRFTTVVDGVKTEHIIKNGKGTYKVAENLAEGLHTVRIVNEYGALSIGKITLTGEMQKTEPSSIYVEVIGDSVSEGAGLFNNESNCATKTFAYLALEALGLDYTYCARGGTALCYAAAGTYVMEDLYILQDHTLKENSPAFVPHKTPDLILIELSQNDDWQWATGTIKPDGTPGEVANKNATDGYYNYEKFDAAFGRLIDLVYGTYGGEQIPILFVFGCMTNPANSVGCERMKLLVNQYAENGYPFKSTVLSTDRSGQGSHPAVPGAAKQASELSAELVRLYPEFSLEIKTPVVVPETPKVEEEEPYIPERVEGTGKLALDFNTDGSFSDYIKSVNELAFPLSGFRNGEIRDNTYYNSGDQCVIEDQTGMMFAGLDTGSPFTYTVEFKLKFEKYDIKNDNTVFNIHGYNDDGKIANWTKPICVDIDGKLHMNAKAEGVQTELGKWYNVKLVVDGKAKKMSLYVDDESLGQINLSLSTETGRCGFRFGNGGGAKFYVDDFSVTKN